MTPSIKPIQTFYKGYHFRSRLEARYAVFFDALGWEWLYEDEGYWLGETLGNYLPDFFLPKFKLFVEVKGEAPSDLELAKCRALRTLTGNAVLASHGLPLTNWGHLFAWNDSTEHQTKATVEWGGAAIVSPGLGDPEEETPRIFHTRVDKEMTLLSYTAAREPRLITCSLSRDPKRTLNGEVYRSLTFNPRIKAAVEAARSARFEHGEAGTIR